MGRTAAIRRRLRGAAPCWLVVVTALVALSACSSGKPSAQGDGTVVKVTVRDFHISVTPKRLSAGDAVLFVNNQGPTNHEVIVVRAGASPLPLRADGVTIDEEALEKTTVGALEPGDPGKVREMRVRLTPGRYDLFCNMAGHYFGGMHTSLVVS
jgi:uncharacterized cupredoxin-like copper-binding protein